MIHSLRNVDPGKLNFFAVLPYAYLYETSVEFCCCETTVTYICIKLKITREKCTHYKKQKTEQVAEYKEIINGVMWTKLVLTVIYSVHMSGHLNERKSIKR